MIIDLAHASAQTIDEVLAIAQKTVLVSHTGVQRKFVSEKKSIRVFIIYFSLYTLISLGVSVAIAFTQPAWIFYLLFLLPFYIICILHLLGIASKNSGRMFIYRKMPLYLSVSSQFLMILGSPSSCIGWHQGATCYSLLQTYWITRALTGVSPDTPHWTAVESMFFIGAVFHIIFMILFLATVRCIASYR